MLEALREKRDEQEKIVYVSPAGDVPQFFVTETETFTYQGVLQRCEWHGYVIEGDVQQIAKMRCTIKYDENYKYLKGIFISDVLVNLRWQNKGYGGKLIDLLIRYAEKLGAEYLCGKLSFVDIGTENDPHRKGKTERLSHFYQRHGFVVGDDKSVFRTVNTTKKP